MTAVGDRVRLKHCTDPYTRLTPGEQGTVTFVNASSFGVTVFVDWDSGSKLGLVAGEDAWEVLSQDSEIPTKGATS